MILRCNYFECPGNIQCAAQNSFLHSHQNFSMSCSKDVPHLNFQLLGPAAKYIHDDIQLYNLVTWVLSCQLQSQWSILLCLLLRYRLIALLSSRDAVVLALRTLFLFFWCLLNSEKLSTLTAYLPRLALLFKSEILSFLGMEFKL